MSRSPFVKLADPATYLPCKWDMREDHEARVYWVEFFKKHVSVILALGIDVALADGEAREKAEARAAACKVEFFAYFDALNANSNGGQRVTMLTMDEARDQILRRHGFVDAFKLLKANENESVIAMLPAVCAQLDALPYEQQFRAVIEGVFAGNIFDMGAAGSAQLLLDGKLDFFQTRSKLPPRPWRVDDFDRFAAAAAAGWKKVVFFVDNAGSDFMLGAVPMMRWLAQRGTQVILAANERPTLNDMTVHDVRAWWLRLCEVEPSLATLPISIMSTGTGEPLIDLSLVDDALNEAAHDADLVVLEGMGRGVESNLDAAFTCDAANLAMIKDPLIAQRLGGKLFDVVCRFR